jgi:type II secretory pathway component PulJ
MVDQAGTNAQAAVSAAKFKHSQVTWVPLEQWRSWDVGGFTLVELMVSIGVLVLLILLATQLLNSAATITTLGHKQMDANSQAREVLDRMAVDVAQMVKRPDVDYYLKSTSTGTPDCTTCAAQAGNDRIAFFSAAGGYYTSPIPTPSPSSKSPISLVAYRVNANTTSSSYNKLERMGKGVAWNGVNSIHIPIRFLDSPTTPTTTISNTWAAAVSSAAADSDYEIIGPQVFRFEYYYLLKNGSLSNTPWDTGAGHTSIAGMQDVAAIVANIALIDPKSRVLLNNSAQVPPPNDNITILGGQLIDWGNTICPACPAQTQWQTTPGLLRAQWQSKLDGITSLPRPAISGIRLYERYFYLSPPTLGTL